MAMVFLGAQLSWESTCLTSRGSQVRALLFPPTYGPVVQLVRTLACHARGRRFEPVSGRQLLPLQLSRQSRGLKILVSMVRFRPKAPLCGCSSSGRAPPCQGGGSEFEPRHPLQLFKRIFLAPQPSGKAWVCKTLIPSSNLGGASKLTLL